MQIQKPKSELDPKDVSFNPEIVAAAWEAFDVGIPAIAAAALVNEFTDFEVTANSGDEVDNDVFFDDEKILVEEKAMGVCSRPVAEKYAVAFIDLDRPDGKVLAINTHQIFQS